MQLQEDKKIYKTSFIIKLITHQLYKIDHLTYQFSDEKITSIILDHIYQLQEFHIFNLNY